MGNIPFWLYAAIIFYFAIGIFAVYLYYDFTRFERGLGWSQKTADAGYMVFLLFAWPVVLFAIIWGAFTDDDDHIEG